MKASNAVAFVLGVVAALAFFAEGASLLLTLAPLQPLSALVFGCALCTGAVVVMQVARFAFLMLAGRILAGPQAVRWQRPQDCPTVWHWLFDSWEPAAGAASGERLLGFEVRTS
ncbi:hypothetical protein D3C71_25110 [compost metagenome]